MKKCCKNCKLCLELHKWDYSLIGKSEWKFTYDGFACMAFASEGEAIHMVGIDINEGMCEMFSPKYDENLDDEPAYWQEYSFERYRCSK